MQSKRLILTVLSVTFVLTHALNLCQEKALELREEEANVVLTGTVKELHSVDSHSGHTHMYKCEIEVKRVIKGYNEVDTQPGHMDPATHHKMIMVDGFGDPKICESDVKPRDTRIFLLSKNGHGELKLNSSLVRITLNNIDEADAAVHDKPFVPRPDPPEEPCEMKYCAFGAVCRVNKTDNQAFCKCIEACTLDYTPVCGTDWKTYSNKCAMRQASCTEQKRIRMRSEGECDEKNPCDDQVCENGAVCVLSTDGMTARCQCPQFCETFGDNVEGGPVCGSDGRDYANACEMRKAACNNHRSITVKHKGRCGFVIRPTSQIPSRTIENEIDLCENFKCSFGAMCKMRDNMPKCECPRCPGDNHPVCGTDGVSYTNKCHLEADNCNNKKTTMVAYNGPCSIWDKNTTEDGCEKLNCQFHSMCISENNKARCACPDTCIMTYKPVCGTDGVTYDNQCFLEIQSCKKQQLIKVSSKGSCDKCKDVVCDNGAVCDNGVCACPKTCPSYRDFVCASNGITYDNKCMMQRAACNRGMTLTVISLGQCEEVSGSGAELGSGVEYEVCDENSCRFGGICDMDAEGMNGCQCSFNCPAVRSPVCGSDGTMYASKCLLQEESCRKQQHISIQAMDNCDDYEDQPCDGKDPLRKSGTNEEYNCELGMDTCPAGAYCHKGPGFAKCCAEDKVKSCADSEHGCCPDGKTASPGPYHSGCPSSCDCYHLGAYTPTCDPDTRQCDCKPGVGGLRCDRCEPGYWGLRKIKDGNSGCLPCGCNIYGSIRDDCEQENGRCVCLPGIMGDKCDKCKDGIVGPGGCIPRISLPTTCSDHTCHYGAKCQQETGHAMCHCEMKCKRELPHGHSGAVCASDGQTYRSECHVQLFACRVQKDTRVVHDGPCGDMGKKTTRGIRSTKPTAAPGTTPEPTPEPMGPTTPEPEPMTTKKMHHMTPTPEPAMPSPMPETVATPEPESETTPEPESESTPEPESESTPEPESESTPEPTTMKKTMMPTRPTAAPGPSGRLGGICLTDVDCEVPNTRCYGFCDCIPGYEASIDQTRCEAITSVTTPISGPDPCASEPCVNGGTCMIDTVIGYVCLCPAGKGGPICDEDVGFFVPAFSGMSYLEVSFSNNALHHIVIDLEFRTLNPNGVLAYNGQKNKDFISLALKDSYVEFKYNLGSGAVTIRSDSPVQLGKFTRVVAQRKAREGRLLVGDQPEVTGTSKAGTSSLNIPKTPFFLGKVDALSEFAYADMGVSMGLVGCIQSFKVKGTGWERIYDLMYPKSTDIITGVEIGECGNNPCKDMPCKNGNCLMIDTENYKCDCNDGYSGTHCENKMSVCASEPCQNGGSCSEGADGSYMCECAEGFGGSMCQTDVQNGLFVPQFRGNSFIERSIPDKVGRELIVEIWFMATQPDGMLFYKGQRSNGKGDYVVLNLVDGYLHFKYNLGSGASDITSPEKIKLDQWHKVVVKRTYKDGSMSINGQDVQGQSKGPSRELNVGLPLYIGGYRSWTSVSSDAGVKSGFYGAIQRFYINGKWIEDLTEGASGSAEVTRYKGTPCSESACLNGGLCVPLLDDYECRCGMGFSGQFCDLSADGVDVNRPVRFDGSTFLKYKNLGSKKMNSETENDISLRFKTKSNHGLLLIVHKGTTVKGDYLTLAMVGGRLQLSYNLGKQSTDNLHILKSSVQVNDGEWHDVRITRNLRKGSLYVDAKPPVVEVSGDGATRLDTAGELYIGGKQSLPSGLPKDYYHGFKGCVTDVKLGTHDLHLIHDQDSHMMTSVEFCDHR